MYNTDKKKISIMTSICILIIALGLIVISVCLSKGIIAGTATCDICREGTIKLEYIPNMNGTHIVKRTCLNSECGYTEEGETVNCLGGTHENGGTCKFCGTVYEPHTTRVTKYKQAETGTHIPVATCTGCNYEQDGQVEACTGGKHDNEGKCGKCGAKYQTHEMTELEYIPNMDGTHIIKRTCSYPECGYTEEGETVNCLGGTHENGGTCKFCGTVYEPHTTRVTKYKQAETGTHIPVTTCTGCNYEQDGQAEACTGGTHDNEGKCGKCGVVYQTHTRNMKPSYRNDNMYSHIEMFKCSCGEIIEEYEEACEGKIVNDDNKYAKEHFGFTCLECGYIYEAHGETMVYSPCAGKDWFGHQFSRKCVLECGYFDDLWESPTDCFGYTHENGGKCTVCGQVCEKHEKTSTIVDYKITNIGHIPLYKCIKDRCNKTFEGELVEHSIIQYVDNENGTHSDECTECGYIVIREHNYVNGYESPYGRRVASNKVNLSVFILADQIEDEACVDCGALRSSADNGCEHSYVEKRNETQHWEECTICGYFKVGSLEGHEFTTYKDNNDGTHSGICSTCKYELKEEHYYEDGVCGECAASVQTCEHEYLLEFNETKHWAKCSKCSDKQIDEEHTYETYTLENGTQAKRCTICNYVLNSTNGEENNNGNNNNNNGNNNGDNNEDNNNDEGKQDEDKNQSNDAGKEEGKDNTIIDTILPNTGISRIIAIAIIIICASTVITIIKMKKYKGI